MIDIKQIFSEIKTQNIAIVDVRTYEEHTQISIPNTLHIPLDELENRLHEIANVEITYFFCRAGRRSMIAEEIAKSKGLQCVGLLQGVAEIIDILA
jgi:rhodanese-related sulfurtransferase